MFTGIIESTAIVSEIIQQGSNLSFALKSSLAAELKVDQSLAHNGVCLTVTEISEETYSVVAVAETLRKTNAGSWKKGDKINLERSMAANGRFDGHIVQGHVDCVAQLENVKEENGSHILTFRLPEATKLMVEKGSICVNGVSLTLFNVGENAFSVAIIPYTWQYTNLSDLRVGDEVNIEFDILGKYIQKMVSSN